MKARLLMSVSALVVIAICVFIAIYQRSDGLWMSATTAVELFVRNAGEGAIDRFHTDMGRYPSSGEGLSALLTAPSGENSGRWRGPYLDSNRIPRDPWGREFRYVAPGIRNQKTYDLFSLGPDGVESDDDLGNWRK